MLVEILIIFVIVLLLGKKFFFLGMDIFGFVDINLVLLCIVNVVIDNFLYVIFLFKLIII